MRFLRILILANLMLVASACDKPPVTAEPAQHAATCDECQEAAKFHYSPFYVAVHDGKHYHTITFKDVGLKTDASPDEALLEVIAESISQELSNGDLGYTTEVGYDQALSDPDNHKACGNQHVYVDVWNRGDDTYGYSLWSGCGEDDNFSWKEVSAQPEGDELYQRVAPLAKSIHDDLKVAEDTRCFTKRC